MRPEHSRGVSRRGRTARHPARQNQQNRSSPINNADSPPLGLDADETVFSDALSEDSAQSSSAADEVAQEADDGEDDDGEDLFGDTYRRDYEARPELDRYDTSLLDDATEYPSMRPSERRRVEQELNARDRLLAEARRPTEGLRRDLIMPDLGVMDLVDGDEEEDQIWKMLRKRREKFRERAGEASMIPVQQAEQAKEELPYCHSQASWTLRVAEILEAVLTGFLCLYRRPSPAAVRTETAHTNLEEPSSADVAEGTYLEKISEMVHADKTSLLVHWDDLRRYCPKVLDWMHQIPLNTLSVLDLAATKVTQERYPKLYAHRRVTCRLRGYNAVDTLRSLNTDALHRLISVRAVVIRMSNVIPKLRLVYFECNRCHCSTNGPYERRDGQVLRVKPVCEDCQSTGPFTISRERTLYENYQKLTLQQQPNQVTPGHLPRQKEAIVLGDLVDTTRPGEELVITGIYQTKPDARLNAQSGFPVLASHILVNNIERRRDIQIEEITEEDFQIIHRLSKNKHIREKIIDSIAPSLWGHRHIKTGLAYAMFGGVPRHTGGSHTIRGDINFLILGDPGMGKSQFLKYVEKTFDRTVYTTGKGTSAVGLTAAVRKDPVTREWCLEGGGLVLADEGICLIDEFDKMGDQDRVSIHEAMEQQTISISKAGIVATLRARCAIIAAANPLLGRYDSSLTFAENVDLSDPILSRFDILAVVKDQINPTQDENLAQYVVGTHMASHPHADRSGTERLNASLLRGHEDPEEDADVIDISAKWVTGSGKIPQSILKKYILYARTNCFPELRIHDEAKLARFYSDIRQASLSGGGMPMTVRHLESIIRMACANAKMRLASSVERSDVDFAISTMLESFIQSQKHAVAMSLGRRFGRYRALAASPDEFLENVLVELFSRKGREALRDHYRGALPANLGPEDIEIVDSAKVTMLEWMTVVRALYGIPGAAVTKFAESRRFLNQYTIHKPGDSTETSQLLIMRRVLTRS